MRRSVIFLVVLAFLPVVRESAVAQFNPTGWIRVRAWSGCGEIFNPFGCSAGGEENLLRS